MSDDDNLALIGTPQEEEETIMSETTSSDGGAPEFDTSDEEREEEREEEEREEEAPRSRKPMRDHVSRKTFSHSLLRKSWLNVFFSVPASQSIRYSSEDTEAHLEHVAGNPSSFTFLEDRV